MSDLWTEATYDHEAQQRALHLETAKHAASGLWSYLALAASPEEYADRTALAADSIQTVATAHDVPVDTLLDVFDHRFALLMEAKDNPFADDSQDSSGDDTKESKDDDSDDSDKSDDSDDDDSDDDDDHNGDGEPDDSDADEDADDTGDGDDEDNSDNDGSTDNQDKNSAPPWAGKFSALAARINAGEDPLAWGGAAPFARSSARKHAGGGDPSELDISRAVDKFKDQAHPDGLNPDWEPLRKALPGEENGWMYMGRRGGQGPFAIHDYKHGITRKRLSLDPQGNSARDLGDGRTAWGDARTHLTNAGHYDMLAQMGDTPQTAYNDEYRRKRNQRLREHGFGVIEGALDSENDPVTDANVPQDPTAPAAPAPVPGMDGGIAETTKPRQMPEGDGTGPGMGMDGITGEFDPDLNGGDIEQGADNEPPGSDFNDSPKTAMHRKLAAIAFEVKKYNPTLSGGQCHKIAQQVYDTYLHKHAEDVNPLLYGDRAPVGDGPISGPLKHWSPADMKGPKPPVPGGGSPIPPKPTTPPTVGGAAGEGAAGELAAGAGEGAAAGELLPMLLL